LFIQVFIQVFIQRSDAAFLIERSKSTTAGSLPAVGLFLVGAPSKTRTCNLLIRSQMLYPIKLWVRASDVNRPVRKGIPVPAAARGRILNPR
jgi:hypothetical protein